MKTKTYPPVYFIAGFFLIIASYFIFPGMNFVPFPVNFIGLFVLILGCMLVSQAYNLFKKYQTPHNFSKSISLIKEDVFKYSRNPMYLGMTLILLGLGICFGNIISLSISLIFFLIIHFVFVPVEEKMLETIFKESYLEYKHKIRKWI